MNNDLISRSELKHKFAQITYVRFTADMGQGGFEMFSEKEIEDIIDKAPTVTPCENCDLYFMAMTKEEQRGGADNETDN